MGYKATEPTVYVVEWPEIHVVKAGFSCNQRWRSFTLRGAEVVDLVRFPSSMDAFEFESVVLAAFRAQCVAGFPDSDAAEPYLGNRGGGWAECFTLPAGRRAIDILHDTDWMAVKVNA